MMAETFPVLAASLPAPLDLPARVALLIASGTWAIHALLMANQMDTPGVKARTAWALLIASVAFSTAAFFSALDAQTVGALCYAAVAWMLLGGAWVLIWAAGAKASKAVQEEWEAQRRQFERTAGALARIYAPALDAPGDAGPHRPPTARPASQAAALAEVARLYSDQPTQPAALATPPHTPKGTP